MKISMLIHRAIVALAKYGDVDVRMEHDSGIEAVPYFKYYEIDNSLMIEGEELDENQ